MLQSKLFYKTLKKPPKNIKALSHILLTRAGFIDQASVGSFSFLPLGFRVLRKIENIVREEMEAIAGQEILMPALVSKDNWQKTKRWQTFDALFKLKGAGNKEYALNPTHEEIISPLSATYVFSYKDLPFYLFQIQTKFRNELRAKSGILRTREFLMKDLYSFHASEKDLDNYYEKIGEVYSKIFKRCGIFAFRTLALGGTFSDYSHEYQAVSESGEDTIYVCQKCSFAINKEIKNKFKKCPNCKSFDFRQEKSIEVANIFKLGTKYSLPFDLKFKNKDGKEESSLRSIFKSGKSGEYEKLFKETGVEDLPLGFDLRFSFPATKPKGAIHLRFVRGKRKNKDALIWETQVQSVGEHSPKIKEQIKTWITDAHNLTDDWFFKMIEGELMRRFE